MTNKELGLKKVVELVERFKEHQIIYKKAEYNETQTRRDFIDPFFKALGWDIDNEHGFSESYREVIHEDKIKISGGTKAPDYSFRLSGKEKLFFLEAKKPYINIKDHIDPSYQIKRYGWNAKMTVSVLTDFEELSIYDCSKEPHSQDAPAKARLYYSTYDQYEKEWDFLWSALSKEAAQNGGFSEYLKKVPQKKGSDTVDKRFLKSLDKWRTLLAETISKENKQLDEDEINFVVQQTIDRIIFLRIAEDRSVEPYGTLKEAIKHGDFHQNLYLQFEQADEKYNSGLFDLMKDKISKSLTIDNKVLKTIINELYYPESPYEFSVLSVEILGSAYEQFLGKVIRIDKAHRAKIEEKPEVRKAGGVYYTPKYVVDYIIKNTVGKLVEKKIPKEISQIKIVDPACGSGSFLIGAYQFLLDWHKNYYTDNGKISKGGKDNPLTPDGNLTTSEKKRILLNNIFGVDIDVNAVEVTKLSLLLKCMEGETEASIASQLRLFNDRVLPTLDNNIKDGNSLVDIDFYGRFLDFGDEKKIKPFNWQKGFPEVFKQGGFDCVIGNPPWGAEFPNDTVEYIRGKYVSASEGSFDSYSAFTEKALTIMTLSGRMGFITPDTFLRKDDFQSFRKYLFHNFSFSELIETGPIFSQVRDTWCCIFFVEKKKPTKTSLVKHKKISRFIVSTEDRLEIFGKNLWESSTEIQQGIWAKKDKLIIGYKATSAEQNIIEKIEKHTRLGSITKYKLSRGEEGSKFNIQESKSGKFKMIIPANIKMNFVADGISINHEGLTPNKLAAIYSHPKIWITRIQKMRWEKRIVSAVDTRTNSAGMKTLQTITTENDLSEDLIFLQAILSSKLINFYCINYLSDDMNQGYLSRLPIKMPAEKEVNIKTEMVKLVIQLIQLNKEVTEVKLATKVSQLQSKIEYCESRINGLVYQLYELTEAEIKIIENI